MLSIFFGRGCCFSGLDIGSRQYIVFPGRFIYTHRLKGANVNDKACVPFFTILSVKKFQYVLDYYCLFLEFVMSVYLSKSCITHRPIFLYEGDCPLSLNLLISFRRVW